MDASAVAPTASKSPNGPRLTGRCLPGALPWAWLGLHVVVASAEEEVGGELLVLVAGEVRLCGHGPVESQLYQPPDRRLVLLRHLHGGRAAAAASSATAHRVIAARVATSEAPWEAASSTGALEQRHGLLRVLLDDALKLGRHVRAVGQLREHRLLGEPAHE